MWHFAELEWKSPGISCLGRGCHGPAKVLKTSVKWVARWLALGRNLYFVSAGLGLVLERRIFCRNIESGNTGTVTSFLSGSWS